MKKKLFDELVESVEEGGKILKEEIKPSRIFENLYEVKNTYFPNTELDVLEGRKERKQKWGKPKDVFQNTIIICQHCHQNSGYTEEGFRHYVISSDIKCHNCGKIIIHYDGGVRC